ncbi:DUF1338 domain-containing protein [Halioxenophilus sp. WMMB6]|uniref:DUF1338 domain-containing protein n=1 Tax=Halioxenophilus sp. WMMB6 TaxID=3073815 RepID=UPI00295E501C|nr:DUF1338 domain-containing protein [Halioxenophilus sp. WMMB6]
MAQTFSVDGFFQSLWQNYTEVTPQALAIHQLLAELGEPVVNDHVAFRTFSESAINLVALESVLADLGYQAYGAFRFEQKKLNARCYKHRTESTAAKIFLSELQIRELSASSQKILRNLTAQIPTELELAPALFWRGCLWQPLEFGAYQELLLESEYAAWLATMGLRVNHFTVSVNHLKRYTSIESINALLVGNGFRLNTVGGEIKGSPQVLLEQSSTLADTIDHCFASGDHHAIPSCFYEFARRYPKLNGELFDSFIEGNADKIFESTVSRSLI